MSNVLRLVRPIERKEGLFKKVSKIEAITFREPFIFSDLYGINIQNMMTEDIALVLSRVTNLTLTEIGNLSLDESNKLQIMFSKIMEKY